MVHRTPVPKQSNHMAKFACTHLNGCKCYRISIFFSSAIPSHAVKYPIGKWHGHFWMVNMTMDWQDAKDNCTQDGGNLASIESETLWNWVLSTFKCSTYTTQNTIQSSTTQNSTAQNCTAQNSATQNCTAQNCTAQNITAQNCTAQNSTAQNHTTSNATVENNWTNG